MKKVFVSYSRADKDEVIPLVERLQKSVGEDFWIDLDGIESGDQFKRRIISAIDAADICLFMYSQSGLDSEWTEKEVGYASRTGKKIVPVRIDDTEVKGWFLFEFNNIDCVDARDELQLEKLVRNLKDWLGAPSNAPVEATSRRTEETRKSEGIVPQEFVDYRDGNRYPVVRIGNQLWFAAGLRYDCDGSCSREYDSGQDETFGRMYTWHAAKRLERDFFQPRGWRIPTVDDIAQLREYVSEHTKYDEATALKSKEIWAEELDSAAANDFREKGMIAPGEKAGFLSGADEYGLNLLPTGYWDVEREVFTTLDEWSIFWTHEVSEFEAATFLLSEGINTSNRIDEHVFDKFCMCSVRFVKDV